MEVKILWSYTALSQLEDIYDYYKIIYRLNDRLVKIISVFDCRQNPAKIEKLGD